MTNNDIEQRGRDTEPLNRLLNRVDVLENGCWVYTGTLAMGGYGRISIDGVQRSTHRFMYTVYKGEIPEGLHIDHLCRNRACVNPEHLEAVTNEENILRGAGWGAENARKNVCKRGHPFDGRKGIERTCSTCQKMHNKKYRDSHKALIASRRKQKSLLAKEELSKVERV